MLGREWSRYFSSGCATTRGYVSLDIDQATEPEDLFGSLVTDGDVIVPRNGVVNADYNAAKNVGMRYTRKQQHRLRSSPNLGSGDAPVDVRVNGGMLNGDSYQPIAGG